MTDARYSTDRPLNLDEEMGRYLDRITRDKDCQHVVLFTADGMVKATSANITRDVAERTAASLSAFQSLSQTLHEFCDAKDGELTWRQSIVDLGDHCVLVFTAGSLTYVAVSVANEVNSPEVAVIASATVKAINGMRHLLGTSERGSTPGWTGA